MRCGRLGDRSVLSVTIAVAAAGCAPVLDWREFDVDGAGLHVSFPCRPDRSSRELATGEPAGANVTVTLLGCEAGGETFAVGFADLGDAARAGPVLRAWRKAATTRLGVPSPKVASLAIAGSTPNPDAASAAFDGHLPDGRSVRARFAWFARGGLVFQAGSVGPPSTRDVEPFYAALRMSE